MKSMVMGKLVGEDGWTVVTDRESDFMSDQVRVRVLQRAGPAAYLEYGPSPAGGIDQRRLTTLPGAELPDDQLSFVLPAHAVSLIARALLDAEPGSERLTNKLEALLDRESERVDRLIGLATRRDSPVTDVVNHG